jgi:ABC-type lipoprotein export system ATPase subunit
MNATGGALKVSELTRTYEPDNRVLKGVSFEVSAGDTLSVVGPSGCGKSTLLNIIGSLDKPTSGSVKLGDVDVTGLSGRELTAFRARSVGFIFQEHHLLPQLSAIENVLLPSMAARDKSAPARARNLLDSVGLADRADAFPSHLSGGERQRTAIARAMINQPELLLCDEPTGNLDRETGDAVVSLFLDAAAERGTTVVIVTHNLELARRPSRCLELRSGRIQPPENSPT